MSGAPRDGGRAARARAALWRSMAPDGGASLGLGLLLLAAILVMVNVVAARHYRRGDLTASKVFSLSAKSRAVLAALRRPLTITVFMVPPDRYSESVYHEVRELCARMSAASSLVRVETVDIDADAARAALLAKRYNISRDDLREGVVVFASGKRSKYVRSRELARYRRGRIVAFRGEAALVGALLAVTSKRERAVCFTTGHGEADITSFAEAGYGRLARAIRRAGYSVRELAARALVAGAGGCDVVAIAGPQRRFAPIELDGLERYLRGGGRLLALLGPVLDRGVRSYRATGLAGPLRRWGIAVIDNIVIDPTSIPGERRYLTWGTRGGYNKVHDVGRALRGRLTIWRLAREVRPLSRVRAGYGRAIWLVRSSKRGWAESDLAQLRRSRPRFDRGVDTRGPVPVAAAAVVQRGASRADGGRRRRRGARGAGGDGPTKLVVIGSERGVLNRRMSGSDYSRDLVLTSLDWLAGTARRLAIGPRRPVHVRLVLDSSQISRVFLLCVVALPALALAAAMLVWWRRRR